MYLVTGGLKKIVVYCANYRVASTATGATLVNKYSGVMVGDHHSPPPQDMDFTNTLVAETVRNPFDVLVSTWFQEGQVDEFKDWVQDVLDDKHEYLRPGKMYGKFPSNVIMRYENLQFEFENLCIWAGLPERKLEVKPSKRDTRAWRKFYTQKTYYKVLDCYKEEIEEYCYDSILVT